MKNIFLTILMAAFSTLLFSQTRTEIKTADLQHPISDYLTKNVSGFNIDKVFRLDTKGVINYEVCVTKESTHEKLTFDKEGKFLKKESCTAECWKSTAKEPSATGKQAGQSSGSKPVKK